MGMDLDGQAEARGRVDLEATVAKNLRWLREGRGLSQQQLGSEIVADYYTQRRIERLRDK